MFRKVIFRLFFGGSTSRLSSIVPHATEELKRIHTKQRAILDDLYIQRVVAEEELRKADKALDTLKEVK